MPEWTKGRVGEEEIGKKQVFHRHNQDTRGPDTLYQLLICINIISVHTIIISWYS